MIGVNMQQTKVLPERVGKKWEPEEETYMLRRIGEGANYITIASECKRMVGGIRSHVRVVACRLMSEGTPIEKVADITGLTVDDITEAMHLRDVAKQMKESKPAPSRPRLKQSTLPTFIANQSQQETLLSVAMEIRDLLRQLVRQDDTESSDRVTVTDI